MVDFLHRLPANIYVCFKSTIPRSNQYTVVDVPFHRLRSGDPVEIKKCGKKEKTPIV